MSRQNPDYPEARSLEDALAVVTAFMTPDLDEDVINEALSNALDGTDHSALVHELGMILRICISVAAQRAGVQPLEFVREINSTMLSLSAEIDADEDDA